jgi:hypothetical protein
VSGAGVPPASDTRIKLPAPKMITPSGLHAPPRNDPLISHTDWGGPPDTSTFFSLPCAANPINRLSGDQNAAISTPSVPASGVDSSRSRERTHS